MGAGYSIRARGTSSAEVYIYEAVGDGFFGGVSAAQFTADLRALGAVDQIDVRINSPGGQVFEGMAIYSQLAEHPARIVTHVDGVAASIASVIAMAGDEIIIAEAGMMMIHQAEGGAVGRATDLRQMADLLETVTGSIADVYAARTRQSNDQLLAWMAAETWMTAAEAVERGFADSVAENMRIAAHLDLSRYAFRAVPADLAARLAPAAPAAPSEPVVDHPFRSAAAERIARMQAKLTLGSASRRQAA
ncbi:MAG: head maturation protease, ClpP-related [Caulobacteraceae bacterium]